MQKNDNVFRMLSKVSRGNNLFIGLCILWVDQEGKTGLLVSSAKCSPWEGVVCGVPASPTQCSLFEL